MIVAKLLALLAKLPDSPVDLGQLRGMLVVAAFIGTECPLARLYASRLHEINRRESGQFLIG